MGHVHNASGCPCCEEMGVNVRSIADLREAARRRISTGGMEHLYQDPVVVQPAQSEPDPVKVTLNVGDEESPDQAEPIGDLMGLSAIVRNQAKLLLEQSGKLESASYRIGYLEAQLEAKEDELRLLTAQKVGVISQFTRWFLGANTR